MCQISKTKPAETPMNLRALITSKLVDIQMHSPIINKMQAFNSMNLDIIPSFNSKVILYTMVILKSTGG